MILGLLIKEAIASCAIEHPTGCPCIICRANEGDLEAFAEIAMAVQGDFTDAELRAVRAAQDRRQS